MKQSTFGLNDQDQTPTIAYGEMPQQRFETYGAAALSDTELIALLINSGIQGNSVLRLASQLIAQAGSMPASLVGSPRISNSSKELAKPRHGNWPRWSRWAAGW